LSIYSNLEAWLASLEARHLGQLQLREVTRALRALSSAYVERRHTIAHGGALNSAGKRAAFALFYAPLHFLATQHVVKELQAHIPPPHTILDLGSGTGAAGAAWASAAGGTSHVVGIDQHPWAVAETRWTYRHFKLRAQARRGDVSRLPSLRGGDAIIASYVLNELDDPRRRQLQNALLAAAQQAVRVLVLEPVARSVTPWWDDFAGQAQRAGAAIDEWRIPVELPPLLGRLDAAAGLNHRELKLRTLYCGGT
jgi:SAM-dependent methyltransferase